MFNVVLSQAVYPEIIHTVSFSFFKILCLFECLQFHHDTV